MFKRSDTTAPHSGNIQFWKRFLLEMRVSPTDGVSAHYIPSVGVTTKAGAALVQSLNYSARKRSIATRKAKKEKVWPLKRLQLTNVRKPPTKAQLRAAEKSVPLKQFIDNMVNKKEARMHVAKTVSTPSVPTESRTPPSQSTSCELNLKTDSPGDYLDPMADIKIDESLPTSAVVLLRAMNQVIRRDRKVTVFQLAHRHDMTVEHCAWLLEELSSAGHTGGIRIEYSAFGRLKRAGDNLNQAYLRNSNLEETEKRARELLQPGYEVRVAGICPPRAGFVEPDETYRGPGIRLSGVEIRELHLITRDELVAKHKDRQ